MVRGYLTFCVALAVALATGNPAAAQSSPASHAAAPADRFPLPTDSLFAPASPVPARTSYQVPSVRPDEPNVTLPGGR